MMKSIAKKLQTVISSLTGDLALGPDRVLFVNARFPMGLGNDNDDARYFFCPAFTLIEILVSLVIAGMVLGALMGGLLATSETLRKVKVSQRLQQELHFSLNRVSDRMRAGSINYDKYAETNNDIHYPVSLFLGPDTEIRKVAYEDGFTLRMNGEPLFSDRFYLQQHSNQQPVFVLSPTQNPFGPGVDFDNYHQPKLTVNLRAVSIEYPEVYYELQTTISSRRYE